MSNTGDASKGNNFLRIRKILRLLLFISIPFGCCGSIYLLDALPGSMLPPAMDFSLNLFESNALVENKTNEIFFITPITTTYGDPRVIPQFGSIRQRNIPLSPDQSVTLSYDSADMPLSGIGVCRDDNECKLLPANNISKYEISSFKDLPPLDSAWLTVVQSHPRYSFGIFIFAGFGFSPLMLLLAWLYVGRLEKKQRNLTAI